MYPWVDHNINTDLIWKRRANWLGDYPGDPKSMPRWDPIVSQTALRGWKQLIPGKTYLVCADTPQARFSCYSPLDNAEIALRRDLFPTYGAALQFIGYELRIGSEQRVRGKYIDFQILQLKNDKRDAIAAHRDRESSDEDEDYEDREDDLMELKVYYDKRIFQWKYKKYASAYNFRFKSLRDGKIHDIDLGSPFSPDEDENHAGYTISVLPIAPNRFGQQTYTRSSVADAASLLARQRYYADVMAEFDDWKRLRFINAIKAALADPKHEFGRARLMREFHNAS